MTKGFVIAAPFSSAGKTTAALSLMAAFKRRGLVVQGFKVGPDFIDPGHHAVITGRPGRNLDGWMLSEEANKYEVGRALAPGDPVDLAVVEGVMGLFDGFSPTGEAGSTAQAAKLLGAPVILVLPARGMARSAAALVHGFNTFDPDLSLAGVIVNKISSPGHLAYLKEPIEAAGVPVLGGLINDPTVVAPERHLGLTTAEDQAWDEAALNALADLAEQGIDLDRLLNLAGEMDCPAPAQTAAPAGQAPAKKVKIGVARDRAFCFYYQANFESLEDAGAELVFFSPLAGEIPRGVDGLYFGGGYPELAGAELAARTELINWLNDQARNGLPIIGECGGFMYLGRSLTDLDGVAHPMTGLLPVDTAMEKKLQSIGYKDVALAAETPLGPTGLTIRGHEFHYSRITSPPPEASEAEPALTVTPGRGGPAKTAGLVRGNVFGSYIHFHLRSNPEAAQNFVRACRERHNKEADHAAR